MELLLNKMTSNIISYSLRVEEDAVGAEERDL
jgi:hypothetical protein